VARWIPLLAVLLVAAACGGGGGDDGSEAKPAEVQVEGEIALTVNRDGWNEIWLMAADGSGRRRLTEREPPGNDAAGSSSPAWSPDGSQIAFAAQTGTRAEDQRLSELFVMNADGSNRRRLTTNDDYDGEPTWSPDGTRIAFTRTSAVGTEAARGGIFVIDAAGGGETQLTRAAAPSFDAAPAWSPEGAQIAFTRATFREGSESAELSLFVMAQDGSELEKIASGGEPAWAPDSNRLAYTSVVDGNGRTCFHECSTSGEIYVVNVDRSGRRRLIESEADDRSPAWSPDGFFIAFVSDGSNRQEHENEIYVMDVETGTARRITQNDVWDLDPTWRPR
jgi:Tol biopolymer transport system component